MSMPLTQTSASLSISLRDACVFTAAKSPVTARFPQPDSLPTRPSFIAGSPLLIRRSHERKPACKAMPVSIRCEQSSQEGNGLDVWLGRLAMVGFAAALSVEVATGKGLLENFGVISPLPTFALGVCLDRNFYLPVSLKELITHLAGSAVVMWFYFSR